LGESDLAKTYIQVAKDVENTLGNHWNGTYLFESTNRPIDGSVMQGLATFNGDWQTTSDDKVAKTIDAYNNSFCNEYAINQNDNKDKLPGILYGRYPGDIYAEGNPWQLLTAVLAEVFYLASEEIVSLPKIQMYLKKFSGYKKLLNVKGNNLDLAESMRDAGDAVMSRLWKYVKNDDGRIDEQIHKTEAEPARNMKSHKFIYNS